MKQFHSRNEFPETARKNPLYRSRNGWLLGVCKGLAEWRDISVGWVRLGVFVTIWLTGLWPGIALYVIVGLIMKPAPVVKPVTDDELDFYDDISTSRKRALQSLKRSFDSLNRRTSRLEHAVTSNEYDWERRLDSGK